MGSKARRQSAIFSRMALIHARELHNCYHRDGKSLLALSAELMVGFAVNASEADGDGKVLTVSEVAEITGISRKTVRTALQKLIGENVIEVIDGGHRVRADYIAELDCNEPFAKIIAAILSAADDLRKL